MNTKIFDDNRIGIKLGSVSEIMKYNALKGTFSICNEEDLYFDYPVDVKEEDGSTTEREPTESEELERILDAFKNGDTLYATFSIDCGKVVPNASTTLQCDLGINQDVYMIKDNKIVEYYIHQIRLSKGYDKVNRKPRGYEHIVANIRYRQQYILARRDMDSVIGEVDRKDFFLSKDDLVKSLLWED